MYSVFFAVSARHCVALLLCVLLAACGGSESQSPPPVADQPPVTPVPVPPVGGSPVELGLMVNFGYNGLAAGAPLNVGAVQSLAVGNGSATYRFPRSGERISGNLTIALDVADPDGIARVLVGFNGTEQALELCASNCGLAFSKTVTGINPRNFGLTPGSIRLELWLEDLLGNRVLFDARDIEWLPEPVVGLNTSRTATNLQVNWTANSSARRYNLYIAEQPGISPGNVLNKQGGRQFLALNQPGFSVPAADPATRYFVLVTGVDSSGESLYSEEHIVQPAGAPQFSLPVAADDQFSLNEDEALTGNLLQNDSHPDGTAFNLDVVAVRPPENGTLQLNADGSFTYQGAANFFGNDSFIYQITDARQQTAQAVVTLTLAAVNDAPVLQNDNYSLDKNTSLTVTAPGLLANDLDIDSPVLSVNTTVVTSVAHGALQLNADGSFSYTPTTGYTGEDFFVYQVSDGQGGEAQARVDLRIEMTNASPVAQNDSYQLNEDERLVVAAQNGILANDSDPDGDLISLVTELVNTTANGQLIVAADGGFQYIPHQDFFGTDSFTYQIKDPAGLVSSATVMLQVVAQNDAPVVQAAAYEVDQAGTLSVPAPGLLAHASDVDDQTLSLLTTPEVAPAKGVLTLAADGAFSYKADVTASGTDSFSYQVKDAAGAVSIGTVGISIIAKAPVFSDRNLQISDLEPQGTSIAQLAVDSSAPGATVNFSIVSGNTQGVFSLSAEGVLSIADAQVLSELGGSVIVLTVKAQDSNGLSALANISVSVLSSAVNAADDNYIVSEDELLSSAVSVLNNDLDQAGLGLTATLVTAPAQGTLSLDPDGHFQYRPNPNFYGQDSFIYSASNGRRAAQAKVSIQVEGVNDAPVLQQSSFSFSEAVPQGTVIGQLSWQDAEADQNYSFAILGGNSAQAFAINDQGELLVASSTALLTLNAEPVTLQVQITDSAGATASATVALQILSALPSAQPDAYELDQDAELVVNAASGVLANDTDPATASLVASLLSGPTSGQLSLASDGSFSYEPNQGFFGQDSFVYLASNGIRSSQAVVNLTVQQAEIVLLANADAYTLTEDTLLSVGAADSLLQNDVIQNNTSTVTVELVQGPASGSLNLNADGTFSYQPASNASGTFSFTYRLTQGTVSSSAAVVQLNVTAVNDPPSVADASATITDAYSNEQTVLTLSVTDVDQGTYTFSILSGNTDDAFEVTAAGVIRVANATALTAGNYSLVVSVTENNDINFSDTATVVITVNHGLLANADSYNLNEDTLLTADSAHSVLQNDTYAVAPAVSVSLVTAPATGTLNLANDGTFTYQPAANAYGSYSFTYRLTQGDLTSEASAELNIAPINDAPLLSDATATISEDYSDLQDVLTLSVTDVDPGSYSFEILAGDDDGVFSVNSDGVIKVADAALLDADQTSSYSLTVKITEDNDLALTDTALVEITVTAATTGDITEVLHDNSFAGGGQLSLQTMLSGEYNEPVQVVPLGDGSSLVLGNVSASSTGKEVFVTRLTTEGSIDTSYADQGVFRHTLFSSSTTEEAVAAVLSSTNELTVLVNYTETGGSGFYLIRLTADGVLDDSFGGNNGYIICGSVQCGGTAKATDMVLNQDGNYVVAGSVNETNGFLLEYDETDYYAGWIDTSDDIVEFDLVRQDSQGKYYGIGKSANGYIVIARFLATYVLDDTFGCNSPCLGYQEYDFSLASSRAYDALLYNDALYVVGSVTDSNAPNSPDALFFKLTANGSLDSAFGNAGFIQVFGHSDYPLHYQSVVFNSAGFSVLTSTEESTLDRVSLSHYELDGEFSLDIPLSVDGQLKAVDLVSDDTRIWLLNQFANPVYGDVDTVSFNWVSKYNAATLSLDTSFSDDGRRWFNVGFGYDVLHGVRRLTASGNVNKTLFYGYSSAYSNGSYQQAYIGRLTSSGAVDPGFGDHGLVLLADSELTELEISAVLEHSSGLIYVAGFGYDSSSNKVGFITRLDQDGVVDATFANGMYDLIPAQAGNYTGSAVTHLEWTSDGHLLVGAEYNQTHDNFDIVLLQLNSDGSLDTGNFGTSASGFVVFSEIDTNAQTQERLSQLKLDPMDNSIVISGEYKLSADPRLYVARYTANGMLMTTANSDANAFGTGGQGYSVINLVDNTSDFTKYSEYMNAMTFDADSNLIFAVSKNYEGDEAHYVYRLLQNGATDNSFNAGQPRQYDSFSDNAAVDMEIKAIYLDDWGRLVMAGVYDDDYLWVGRVLMDGADAGRWDPNFEPESDTFGAYLMDTAILFYEGVVELNGNKLIVGWLDPDNDYSATFRQYFIYEYDPNPV